jgi:alpha-galactosidase
MLLQKISGVCAGAAIAFLSTSCIGSGPVTASTGGHSDSIGSSSPAQPSVGNSVEKLKGPLKIYILAGQSNMQGQSHVGTVPRMAVSSNSKALHDKILDENGKPRVHENVYIAAFSQDGGYKIKPTDQEKHGPLTVGYGGDLKTKFMLGPELGFGITMGELAGEPILIIKTAWGGKSLGQDFRPPSAGIPPLDAKYAAKLKEEGKYEETMAGIAEKNGKFYRKMMAHVKTVLADPGKYCPAYNPEQGYEIAGFGWFQGYNDRFAGPPYDFYTDLLGKFIRDVRKELNAPQMPFAIGVIGIGGNSEKKEAELLFRKAMAAPAEMPEFKGNVAAIHTADFWDDELPAARAKAREADRIWDNSEYWTSLDGMKPEDRIWKYTSFELDPKEQYRKLAEGEKGDERTLTGTVPDAMKGWLEAGFDASKWQEGPAPIGKGEKKRKKNSPEQKLYQSLWGDGNMLLMRTSIDLKRSDFVRYRLRIQSTGSFLVYLNGHIIRNFPWWKGDGLRTFDLTEEQSKHFKQGTNVLAFYGNMGIDKGGIYNAVDLMLEGITQEQVDDITTKQAEVCTPRDIAVSRGQSHQVFHYRGSAYTYSLIGEALAKAIAAMNTKQGQKK